MLRDLKQFLLRGNVVDLAVAVIIGVAFGAVVNSLVDDVIMAFIGAVVGKPNFDQLTWNVGDGVVAYGRFLTALVTFLLVGTAVFLLVRVVERVMPRPKEETGRTEIELLTQIRDELRSFD